VTQPWYSFQIVEIQGEFASELLVFESRNQRLRFMSAVQEICPKVRMFRIGSPSVASARAPDRKEDGPSDMNQLGDRQPRTRPMKYRVQFLDETGNVIPDSQADAHDVAEALALIEDVQWPLDAVRMRVLDADGRAVHQGVTADARHTLAVLARTPRSGPQILRLDDGLALVITGLGERRVVTLRKPLIERRPRAPGLKTLPFFLWRG
jgi:hypothetical protein